MPFVIMASDHQLLSAIHFVAFVYLYLTAIYQKFW